jgi:anti-anti-sigma regulatory factor
MALGGELTIARARQMKDTLLGHLRGTKSLDVDLSGVEEMDTAGFQLLLLLKKEAAARRKGLSITAHSKATSLVFELYNMEGYF